MGKTVRKTYYVDEDLVKEFDKIAYTFLYEKDTNTATMLKVLRENPTLPLKSISWILEKEHKIVRTRKATLRNMATACDIPFTE